MNKLKAILLLSILIISAASISYAGIPKVLNYQGKFTDKEDNPLSGNYLVTFRFYDTESEGAVLWEEGHILVIKDGVFNVLLGSIKPLEIDFNKNLWLGIEIANDGEMSPRIKLASSAYAFNAKTIDMINASQLVRNDTDSVISGTVTIKKDLILKGNFAEANKVVLTNSLGKSYYLWVDNTGNLRIEEGRPSGDKAGSVIVKEAPGAQSSDFLHSIYSLVILVIVVLLILLMYTRKKK